jgi:arylsulfatase A-like enzyme
MRIGPASWIAAALAAALAPGAALPAPAQPHSVILFVADGLRSGIVTPQTAPALAAVRDQGVDFRNSHSLYPTVTTPNASAIATGHYLGDTGDFGNTLYVGPEALPAPVGALTAPLEDDTVLSLLDQRYGGNVLNEDSLLAVARAQGFSTAAIGKLGPVSIQDVGERTGLGTIVIDDHTGRPSPDGVPLAPAVAAAIQAAGLAPKPPGRGANGDAGGFDRPGTLVANVEQQAWFAKVAAQVLLPRFKAAGKPFVMVYWSRDPDGTQHNQGDSLGRLRPGVNGPTSLAAIRNASDNLQTLRDALAALGLDKTTDIVVTADHGFSTVSKESAGSPAAHLRYADTPPGALPTGFVSIDLAMALELPLWSPMGDAIDPKAGQHPKGSALLGPSAAHPQVVVAANGGSDLIYLPASDRRRALVERIVQILTAQDYTGGIFVDDAFGIVPGTLPMSLVGLKGSALTPQPAIAVGFRNYADACEQPDTCQIEVADTELQQGQGIHGSFGRGDTHNFMAAIGPDFKAGFLDPAPVSNADLAQTLARVLGLDLTAKGKLVGRVASEALAGGARMAHTRGSVRSKPTPDGFYTQLDYQEAGGAQYFDAAGMPGRVFGVDPKPPSPASAAPQKPRVESRLSRPDGLAPSGADGPLALATDRPGG